jgi:hypothetical protein
MTRYTDEPEAYPGQHAVIAGRLIEHERDLAVIARIGGNEYRRTAFAQGRWYPHRQDPYNIASWAMLGAAADRFTPGFARQLQSTVKVSGQFYCIDHPGGCGNVLSESELRLLDGNR